MKKVKFTYEQHEEMGNRIRAVRRELQNMLIVFGNSYPLKDYENYVNRADKALLNLQMNMENRAFKEHPTIAKLGVY